MTLRKLFLPINHLIFDFIRNEHNGKERRHLCRMQGEVLAYVDGKLYIFYLENKHMLVILRKLLRITKVYVFFIDSFTNTINTF